MDLDDWLEEQKEIDPNFNKQAFCKLIGIHPTHLSRLLNGSSGARPELAKRIEKITKGEITAYQIVSERSKHRFCVCGRELSNK